VDVGCHHQFLGSNTVNPYSRGWRGVVVDGNRELIELFRRTRSRDISICSVVSSRERPITFTLAKQPDLSTVSPEFEKLFIGEAGVKERVEVNTITLQIILEKNKVPSAFDLLSIDVEGHDYDVLTSFDINTFRPRVIVIEFSTDRIRSYLEQNQYQLRSFSVGNGIFVDGRS
jgi:FkbM family methyltransferase